RVVIRYPSAGGRTASTTRTWRAAMTSHDNAENGASRIVDAGLQAARFQKSDLLDELDAVAGAQRSHHRAAAVVEAAVGADGEVAVLHGTGADGDDLMGFVR